MGSYEGEETCGVTVRPAGRGRDGKGRQVALVHSGETFGCHLSLHICLSESTHWSDISCGSAHTEPAISL